jgi:hypothetical protein
MRLSPRPITSLALAGFLVTAGPALAAQPRGETWGKPGISFLQYRTDAVECTYDAESKAPVNIPPVDLAYMTDTAQMGSRPAQDTAAPAPDLNGLLDYVAQTQMRKDRAWRNVARQLEPALTACLTSRGYQRVKLNEAQADELRRLKPGTRARHVYLWSLAVDPAVLSTQAQVEPVERNRKKR